VRELAEGIFCEIEWEGANVGAISTEEGLVLVDSPMLPRDAHTWKEQIAQHSDEPAIFLINTDYHFDHIMTDCLLCDRVIAHSLAEPAFLAQNGEVFEQMVEAFFPDTNQEDRKKIRKLKSIPPSITFSETLILNMGSRRIELTRMGGHTPATSVVFLPDDGILFTGDVHVHDRHPFPGDGNLLEWIEALERIGRMDVSTIVPGHGEPCGLDSVARLKEFFETMESRVLELIRKGCDRDEIGDRVDLLSFFPVEKGKEARTQSFIRLGVDRMYTQLTDPPPEGEEL